MFTKNLNTKLFSKILMFLMCSNLFLANNFAAEKLSEEKPSEQSEEIKKLRQEMKELRLRENMRPGGYERTSNAGETIRTSIMTGLGAAFGSQLVDLMQKAFTREDHNANKKDEHELGFQWKKLLAALGIGCGISALSAIMLSVLDGTMSASKNTLGKGIERTLELITSPTKLWNFVRNYGSKPISLQDIERWKKTTTTLIESILSESANSAVNCNLKRKTASALMPSSDEQSEELNDGQDEKWQKIKDLFLVRIKQIIIAINLRAKFYGNDDDMKNCIENFTSAATALCEQIEKTQTMSDLTNAETSTSIKFLHKQIATMLDELNILVRERSWQKDSNHGGMSSASTNRYGSDYQSSSY